MKPLTFDQKIAICLIASGDYKHAGRWTAGDSLVRKELALRMDGVGGTRYTLTADGLVESRALTALLIREHAGGSPYWRAWNFYPNSEKAEQAHRREIQGRGKTAWSWWGNAETAGKMLRDPSYSP